MKDWHLVLVSPLYKCMRFKMTTLTIINLQSRDFLNCGGTRMVPVLTIHALVCAFLKNGDREVAEAIVAYVKHISTSCQPSDPDSVHPEKAVHRYPNWADMSKKEKKEVKERLVIENHDVKKKYTTYFRRILQSFERRDVSEIDLKINVEGLKKLPELASASSAKEVFYIIMQHSSFFNYQLLEDVVEELGNEEEKQCCLNIRMTSSNHIYKDPSLKYLWTPFLLVPPSLQLTILV